MADDVPAARAAFLSLLSDVVEQHSLETHLEGVGGGTEAPPGVLRSDWLLPDRESERFKRRPVSSGLTALTPVGLGVQSVVCTCKHNRPSLLLFPFSLNPIRDEMRM